MKKRIFAAGLSVIALSLALLPPMSSMAEKTRLITWEKSNKKNRVELYLELQNQEPVESVTAFSLDLIFESEYPLSEEPKFYFRDGFDKTTVHETRYDEEDQILTIYVADADPVLKKGEQVRLGTVEISKEEEENVTISVDDRNFQYVDTLYEKGFVSEFGDTQSYEMILKKPEETIPPETEEPETEAPETEEPETETPELKPVRNDDDEEEIWTVRPNGSWKMDYKGWRFVPFDGRSLAGSWYDCSWDGKQGWYHFNSAGYMETGWFTDADGHIYFLHDQNDSQIGAMYTGWHQIGGMEYYFQETSIAGQPKGSLVKNAVKRPVVMAPGNSQ